MSTRKKHRRKATTCPNCGTALAAKMNFCSTCGQENHDLKVPIGHLIYEVVEGIFHFDTKFWTTTKAIFTRPGRITKDFLEGRRARYVPPVRLYIFVSFVFFFLVSVLSDRGIDAVDQATKPGPALKKALDEELTRFTHAPDSALAGRVMRLPSTRRDALFDSLEARQRREKAENTAFNPSVWKSYVERQVGEQLRRTTGDSLHQATLDKQEVATGTDSGTPETGNTLAFSSTIPRRDLMRLKTFSDAQIDSVLQANGQESGWFTRAMARQASRFVSRENSGETVKSQSRELIHKVVKNASVMMFILMPVVALLLLALYHRRERFYYEHLIFSVHLHTVVFLIFSLAFVVWLGSRYDGVFGWAALLTGAYLWLSLKTVYGQGWLRTSLKFFLLGLGYTLCFSALFVLTTFISFLTF